MLFAGKRIVDLDETGGAVRHREGSCNHSRCARFQNYANRAGTVCRRGAAAVVRRRIVAARGNGNNRPPLPHSTSACAAFFLVSITISFRISSPYWLKRFHG